MVVSRPSHHRGIGHTYGIHPGSQCNIHLSLVADPFDHSVVYIGGDRQPANNENGNPGVQFPNSLGGFGFPGRLFRVDADLAPLVAAYNDTPTGACAARGVGVQAVVGCVGPGVITVEVAVPAGEVAVGGRPPMNAREVTVSLIGTADGYDDIAVRGAIPLGEEFELESIPLAWADAGEALDVAIPLVQGGSVTRSCTAQ